MTDQVNQDELFAEFWETLHKTYFRPVSLQDKNILTHIRTKILRESDNHGLSDFPVFRDQDSVEAMAALVSSKYEASFGSGMEDLNRRNFANMTKHYYLAMHYYLPLLLEDTEVGMSLKGCDAQQRRYDPVSTKEV